MTDLEIFRIWLYRSGHEVLSWWLLTTLAGQADWQTRWISGYIDPAQSPPYNPLPADALQKAKHNLATHFSVAGVVERFDESLLLLKRRFGWRYVFYMKRNVTRTRPAREELPSDTVRFIETHTELDGELHEFARRRLDERIQAEGAPFQREVQTFQRLNSIVGAPWAGYFILRKRLARLLSRSA